MSTLLFTGRVHGTVDACLPAFLFIALLGVAHAGNATKAYTNLYTFCQQANCADGLDPEAGLITDNAGNLYGTTAAGGTGGGPTYNCVVGDCGTVFRLAPDGTETVLYSFCSQPNCTDGYGPTSTLIRDAAGNLYGTTEYGGASSAACGEECGTVFKIAPNGTETVLYSFGQQPGAADGQQPDAGVIMDRNGNLYGTTYWGGVLGWGTAFRLAANGTETVLHDFANGSDGASPVGGLIMKGKNLYGTTAFGGLANCANGGTCGVIFKVTTSGAETVLYSFCAQPNCSDGANPISGLVEDKAGNLYGTTIGGGLSTAGCGNPYQGNSDCGTVFELAAGGTETVLYSFCSQFNGTSNCLDGDNPRAGLLLVQKSTGNILYGTTGTGAEFDTTSATVFKVVGGTETVLHTFDDSPPHAGLMMRRGYLYGTTANANTPGFVFRSGM